MMQSENHKKCGETWNLFSCIAFDDHETFARNFGKFQYPDWIGWKLEEKYYLAYST